MKKSVVMILTNGFEPDVRVYKEAKYLVANNCDVTILCWDREVSDSLKEKECLEGINILRYKIKSKYGTRWKQIGAYLKYLYNCKQYLKLNKVEYIHCHDIDGATIGYLSKKSATKMIFDMHEFYETGGNFSRILWRYLTIFLIKKSYAGIYVTSSYLSSSYRSIVNKLYPLRNYPASDMIKYVKKTNSEVFRIGYHGVVRNQIDDFKALFEAVKEMGDVRVDINGGGIDLGELTRSAEKYKNVYVHGPYNGILESTKLYMNTDLLFCAYDSNDPNYQGDTEVIKFYEAIFTGTPILVSKNIGMEKKVVDNEFGLSCDTKNVDEIKMSIEKIKNNKLLWDKFHESELLKSSNYSWEKAVKVLDEIYHLEA